MKASVFLFAFTLLFHSLLAQDALSECWNKNKVPWLSSALTLTFSESKKELYHSPSPWQQLNYSGKGIVSYHGGKFFKQDTLTRGKRSFTSKVLIGDSLLFIEEGKDPVTEITENLQTEHLFATARYLPLPLVEHFKKKRAKLVSKDKTFDVYECEIGEITTRVQINKRAHQVNKITTLEEDEFYGDVETEYAYQYTNKKAPFIPSMVIVSRMNKRIVDTIMLTLANQPVPDTDLPSRPAGYKRIAEPLDSPHVKLSDYNEHIHFIEMPHAGTRVLVVEFAEFFLVSDAPLNSENGELLMSAIHKIAPGKSIRYFTFGHWHPHYTGGIRPFINEGVTILAPKCDEEIISYLAKAEHTLHPDKQQLHPRDPKMEEIKDSLTISDGSYSIKLFFMGDRSKHTSDYTFCYFPKEKMIFEGDLIWIKKEGAMDKAGDTQAGFYYQVKDLGLAVDTVFQSWNINSKKYKTIISFPEIEASVTGR